jgi:hypothetical protein
MRAPVLILIAGTALILPGCEKKSEPEPPPIEPEPPPVFPEP